MSKHLLAHLFQHKSSENVSVSHVGTSSKKKKNKQSVWVGPDDVTYRKGSEVQSVPDYQFLSRTYPSAKSVIIIESMEMRQRKTVVGFSG